MKKQKFFLGMSITLALSCIASPWALAAGYPDKPVRLIVPYPPGGNLDTTARAIANAMSKSLNQTMVVENIGGAGGSIGSANVARAQPDGYTLLATTLVPLVVNPTLMPSVKTTLNDFSVVGMMAVVPSVVAINTKQASQVKREDFKSWLEHARANPGTVSVGHSGNGTTNHIIAAQIERQFDVQFNNVPYRGSAPAVTDLLGGQIDAIVDQLTSSQPHIASGNFTALAVTGAKRAPGLPEVATIAELTGSDFDFVTYSAILAPEGTPENIRNILNKALQEAATDQSVRKQLDAVGAQTVPASLPDASQLIAQEQKKLQAIIDAGLIKKE